MAFGPQADDFAQDTTEDPRTLADEHYGSNICTSGGRFPVSSMR